MEFHTNKTPRFVKALLDNSIKVTNKTTKEILVDGDISEIFKIDNLVIMSVVEMDAIKVFDFTFEEFTKLILDEELTINDEGNVLEYIINQP